MPATLKSELEAKAAELQPSNKSAAKTWLVKQMNAWESIQNLSVAADADDIEMIKKLAEKKFPLDYVSQEVFINEQGVPQQPLTLAELNLKAREQFNSHALTVEGDSKVTGLPVVMHDRQFILIPFSAFSGGPNVSIMNNLGEQVEFDKENIFASKDYPFVIVMPKSIPSSTTNAKLATDKEYREIVGKPIFFIGYTTTNIQIFPVKLNAVSDQTLVLSSRIPNNFIEGTTLVNPEEDLTLGSMIAFKKEFPKVQWGTRNSVNFLRRTIETKNPFLTCVRVDRLERWEKLDFEKLAKQRKKLDSVNKLLWDFILLNTSTRLVDTEKLAIVGQTVSKYKDELKTRMEKSRFDRLFRQYLQDLIMLIKSELRDVNPDEFYTIYRYDLKQAANALRSVSAFYDNAIRTNSFSPLVPDDIKRAQNR